MPELALGTPAAPLTFVPMKLPRMMLPLVAVPLVWIPSAPLPEMTFRAAAVVPPVAWGAEGGAARGGGVGREGGVGCAGGAEVAPVAPARAPLRPRGGPGGVVPDQCPLHDLQLDVAENAAAIRTSHLTSSHRC